MTNFFKEFADLTEQLDTHIMRSTELMNIKKSELKLVMMKDAASDAEIEVARAGCIDAFAASIDGMIAIGKKMNMLKAKI